MTHLPLRTNLDEHFQNEKVEMPYPCILFRDAGEEFPLVISCLEPGNLPILVQQGNSTIMLDFKTSTSALNLNKLLGLYSFQVLISKEESYNIESIFDLMEVLPWML